MPVCKKSAGSSSAPAGGCFLVSPEREDCAFVFCCICGVVLTLSSPGVAGSPVVGLPTCREKRQDARASVTNLGCRLLSELPIYEGVEQEACVGSAHLAPSGCMGQCLGVPLRSLSPDPGRPREQYCTSALFKTK